MGKMVNTAKLVYDTLFNLMSGLGTSKDKMTGTQYALTVFSVADLEAAYRGDWLTRKIINIPPEDSTRQWRAWQAEDDQIEAIETVERQLDVLNKTQWAMKLDRLYGGSALILGVEGGEGAGAATELKLENIRKDSLKFIHAVSRYELTTSPELNMDLTSPYFRRPQWYERQIPGAMPIRIHPSRVIPFVSNPLPNPEASPASEGWGDPLLQSIDDAIKQTGITIASMAALVQESKFDIIKIPELSANLSTQEYADRLTTRFSYANVIKSIVNAKLMDSEEDFERVNVQWSGLPDVARVFLLIASGAGDIPATRLFGQAPQGLNSTGESDLQNYHERLASDQKTIMTPRMTPLDEVIIRSALGSRDPSIYYEWNPIAQMPVEKKAELDHKKAQTFQIDLNSGLFSPEVMRTVRENQLVEDGVYPGLEAAVEEEGDDPDIPATQSREIEAENAEAQRTALIAKSKQITQRPPARRAARDEFDPNQPRDPDGKWTKTGGGKPDYEAGDPEDNPDFDPGPEPGSEEEAYFKEQEIAQQIANAHPDWDETQIEMAVKLKMEMSAEPGPGDGPDPSSLKKIEGAKGSNEGGVYQASDGSKHYVKFYKNPEQGRTEALTAQIYERMGIETAKPRIGTVDGKEAVIAPWNDNFKPMLPSELENLKSADRFTLARMEAAAKLTKNWDIVGLQYDNIVRNKATGDLVAVDQGGSLTFRAQGGNKDYGPDPADTDFSKSNNAATKVFAQLTPAARATAIKHVQPVNVRDLFHQSGLKNSARLAAMYELRLEKLLSTTKDELTLDAYLGDGYLSDKYDPNQPRDPAGTSTGGQWTSAGGAKIEKLNLEKFTTEGKKLNTLQAQELKLQKMLAVETDEAKKALIKKHIVSVLQAQHAAHKAAGKNTLAAKAEYKLSKWGATPTHQPLSLEQQKALLKPAEPKLGSFVKSDPKKPAPAATTPSQAEELAKLQAKENAGGKLSEAEFDKMIELEKLKAKGQLGVAAPAAAAAGAATAAAAAQAAQPTPPYSVGPKQPWTEADRKAIGAYTGSAYRELNEQLRKGQLTEDKWNRTKALNTALDKLPVHTSQVYRKANLPPEIRALYVPGMIVEERAFTSTSKNLGVWSGATRYTIQPRPGGNARDIQSISHHKHEAEVLFKSGTRFRVKHVDVKPDTTDIIMEEV